MLDVEREDVFYAMAESHKALGNTDKSIELMKHALEMCKNPSIARDLSIMLSESGRTEEGIQICKSIFIREKSRRERGFDKDIFDDNHSFLMQGISTCLKKMGYNDQADGFLAILDKAYQRTLSDEEQKAFQRTFDKLPENLRNRLNAGGRHFGDVITDHVLTTLQSLNL